MLNQDYFCFVLNPVPEIEAWRIGVMFDTINTLNDICFIDEFDEVMTNKFSIMYATHKITDTLLNLNVLLINKLYIVFFI